MKFLNKYTLIWMGHLLASFALARLALESLGESTDDLLLFISSFLAIFFGLWLLSKIIFHPYFNRLKAIFRLFWFFNIEFLKANIHLSYTILSPKMPLDPAVVSIPLDIKKDMEIMLLANLITLTPGTLSLDVSKDHRFLFVHTLHLKKGGIEAFKKSIKSGFEKKIIALSL